MRNRKHPVRRCEREPFVPSLARARVAVRGAEKLDTGRLRQHDLSVLRVFLHKKIHSRRK